MVYWRGRECPDTIVLYLDTRSDSSMLIIGVAMIRKSHYQMRRDMDLLRLLLLKLAGENVDLASYSKEQIDYHEALIIEAGFAHGRTHRYVGGVIDSSLEMLTWDGQEFLSSIQSATVWGDVKNRASKIGVFTLPIIQAVVSEVIKSKLV